MATKTHTLSSYLDTYIVTIMLQHSADPDHSTSRKSLFEETEQGKKTLTTNKHTPKCKTVERIMTFK
jgi:hypothetical protein